jgi:hypothetical protein
MVASSQGLVIPVQKRIGAEDYLYFAVKALPGRIGHCRHAAPLPRALPDAIAAQAEPTTVTAMAA